MRAQRRALVTCMLVGGLAWAASPAARAQEDDEALDLTVRKPVLARTWCNPLNLDYAFASRRDAVAPSTPHRSTADPVCVPVGGEYFLVSTHQEGYWMSSDLLRWRFIRRMFKRNQDPMCAPAAWPTSKGLLVLPSFDGGEMPLYLSTDPARNVWREVMPAFAPKVGAPSLFEDRDGRLYLYWGASNRLPLYGVELDPVTYQPLGEPIELVRLHPREHGWEQPGEDNQGGALDPSIEGAWVNRIGDRYYLQYAAPGAEHNVCGDGAYTSERPLGPYTYQVHNPFSFKPTGFVRGAGHGSTFADVRGNLWHMASMVVGARHKLERRLGLFPAGVDREGVLYCDTSFGDYPHFMPRKVQDPRSLFTGWMLLSYRKKAWASASAAGHAPGLATDEDAKTWWSAPDNAPGRWLAVDLGGLRTVRAVQLNFAEHEATSYGKQDDARHRYRLEASTDKRTWSAVVDRSRSTRETPHEYLELAEPLTARYLRVVNVGMPTGCFALSDLRAFGRAGGMRPAQVTGVVVRRDPQDARHVSLAWKPVRKAYAYEVSYGVAPGKLYTSFLVYAATAYELRTLSTGASYWFSVRAVGESGVSRRASDLVGAPAGVE